jgi:predicted outer membrane repeat protein
MKKSLVICLLVLFITMLGNEIVLSKTIYVDADATGQNNGTSWTNACLLVQSALDSAVSGDQIWVAQGTYKPNVKVNGTTDRHKSYLLKLGVSLYGGFTGTETALSQRNWEDNLTILSGDIGNAGDSTDNCYHIVTYPSSVTMDSTTVFDGFVVKHGNANVSQPDNKGAAMILYKNGSPLIKNCTFAYNRTTNNGGAIYNAESSPKFYNCTFDNNLSTSYGGAIYNYYAHKTFITNCKISNNESGYGGGICSNLSDSSKIESTDISYNKSSSYGGGIYLSSGTIINCQIYNNTSTGSGGGVSLSGGAITNCQIYNNIASSGGGVAARNSPTYCVVTNCQIYNNISENSEGGGGGVSGCTVTNCQIYNNTASGEGGGVSSGTMTNCHIFNNKATSGGGVSTSSGPVSNCTIAYNSAEKGGGIYCMWTNIKNTILWANSASLEANEIYVSEQTLNIDNSCFSNGNGDIFGTINESNCIHTNPLFDDPNDNDYRIYGVSPCIDAGNNTYISEQYDIRGVGYPRKLKGTDSSQAGTVDMGAFEFKKGYDKQTPPDLTPAILLLPVNNDTTVSTVATFKWNKVENATSYRIQISNSNTFDTKYVNQIETDTVVVLTGLNPYMKQYWRIAALNNTDSLWSVKWSFTTNNVSLPIVITNSVSSITKNSATCGGNVTDEGDSIVTARGVCWSTSSNPIIANSKTTNGTGTGSYTSNVTELTPNTVYYVRAYATNAIGTSYGDNVVFTSQANVTTSVIYNITSNSAYTGGNISVDGNASVTARGICWSTSQNPTTANSKTTNGTGTGSFSSTITGLNPNTKYYVRAYATNAGGTGYGNQDSLTTLPLVKTVKIKAILNGLWSNDKHFPAPIFIELRTGTTLINSTVSKRIAASIDTLGYSEADFGLLTDGEYWLVVRTAGYLPVAAPSKISLSTSGITYDFTTSSDKSVSGTNAMIQPVNPGPWMMRGGDFNNSRNVTATDINQYILPNNGKNVSSTIPAP